MKEWEKPENDLEYDLLQSVLIKEKVKNNEYAQKLYAALCNTLWNKGDSKKDWSCSWRYAGDIVAELRQIGEDYISFYCSGIGQGTPEGIVEPEIEKDMKDLNWSWKNYPLEK